MKLSSETLNVLKNFSTINPSIVVKEGKILETISSSKTIKAKAKVTTEFPKRFAMYNLNKFISMLSFYQNPEVRFNDNSLTVFQGSEETHLPYSDEATIIKVPEKEIKLPSVDVSVSITNDNIKNVEKALGLLSVPEILITGDGTSVSLQAADSKNPTGDVHSIKIGETNKTFRAIFKAENIKVLPGDYSVEVCSKGISRWFNNDVEYFIAVESSSSF